MSINIYIYIDLWNKLVFSHITSKFSANNTKLCF